MSEPNLQNIGIDEESAKRLRDVFRSYAFVRMCTLDDMMDAASRPLFGRVRHFDRPNIIECTEYRDVTEEPEPLLLPAPRE